MSSSSSVSPSGGTKNAIAAIEAGVSEEREAEVHERRPVDAGADAVLERLAGVDRRDLEHEVAELDARLARHPAAAADGRR